MTLLEVFWIKEKSSKTLRLITNFKELAQYSLNSTWDAGGTLLFQGHNFLSSSTEAYCKHQIKHKSRQEGSREGWGHMEWRQSSWNEFSLSCSPGGSIRPERCWSVCTKKNHVSPQKHNPLPSINPLQSHVGGANMMFFTSSLLHNMTHFLLVAQRRWCHTGHRLCTGGSF